MKSAAPAQTLSPAVGVPSRVTVPDTDVSVLSSACAGAATNEVAAATVAPMMAPMRRRENANGFKKSPRMFLCQAAAKPAVLIKGDRWWPAVQLRGSHVGQCHVTFLVRFDTVEALM